MDAKDYRGWKRWSILAYLEELQRTRGIRVVVVHWPIAHEPIEDCYSVRYTEVAAADFRAWLASETARLGLAYLDLRDLLSPEMFIDSMHITPEGHRRIAGEVVQVLDPVLRSLAAARARESSASQ